MIGDKRKEYLMGLSMGIAFNNYSNSQDTGLCILIKRAIDNGVIKNRISNIATLDFNEFLNYNFSYNGSVIKEIESALKILGINLTVFNYYSLSQFLTHQKALLLGDKPKLERILFNTDIIEKIEIAEDEEDVENLSIWNEYRVRIMKSGLERLWSTSEGFQKKLTNVDDGLIYVNGDDSFWNVSNKIPIKEMLIPKREKDMNVLGKILTLIKYKLN